MRDVPRVDGFAHLAVLRLARSAAGGLGFRRAGDALARLVNDVDALDNLYLRISIPACGRHFAPACAGFAALARHTLGVLLLLPFGCVAFYLPTLAARAAGDAVSARDRHGRPAQCRARCALSGLREVKIFAAKAGCWHLCRRARPDLLAAQRTLVGKTSALTAIAFVTARPACWPPC